MPCYDGRSADHVAEVRRQRDENARLLCMVMRQLELADSTVGGGYQANAADQLCRLIPGLREWWEAHKRFDEEDGRRQP